MLADRDPGPLARLREVMVDESVPSMVFQRLTADEPETLPEIAREWKVPRGRFVEWFTTTHAGLYDAALRVLTEALAREALEQADAATPEDVSARKLRVDTRLRLAEKWDRARYGAREMGAAGAGITVVVDRSCGGAVAVLAGGNTVMVGGVSRETLVPGTEALDVEKAEDI